MDYDAISHALLITAYWESGPDQGAWNEEIVNAGSDRVEVGVLNQEKADEKEDIGLGGWLTVIGQDATPSMSSHPSEILELTLLVEPTLFSFPSRHHPLPANGSSSDRPAFHTTFDHPTGLHPTLRITIPNPNPSTPTLRRPAHSCALHAYLTIPSSLFLDRHAFTDPLFLSSHNLNSLRALNGATDLEAPNWTVKQWGSAALLELRPPSPSSTHAYTATIPLHTRYLTPSSSTHKNTTLPYPSLFWACMADEGAAGSAKMAVNPFDRVNLGFDGLFGDRTFFYHLDPQPAPLGPASLAATLAIPVLDLRQTAWVEPGTVASITLGMLWVLWKLFGPLGGARKAHAGTGAKKDA